MSCLINGEPLLHRFRTAVEHLTVVILQVLRRLGNCGIRGGCYFSLLKPHYTCFVTLSGRAVLAQPVAPGPLSRCQRAESSRKMRISKRLHGGAVFTGS